MRLRLGSRTYDLSTRALVMGVGGAVAGADLVELASPAGGVALPVCIRATDDAGVDRALAGGADLVWLTDPTADALRRCAGAVVAVVVPAAAVGDAAGAGVAPD